MSIDGTLGIGFTINDRRTVGIATSANLVVNQTPSITFADGVGITQANVVYAGTLALVSGAKSVDISGVLADLYGTVITPVRLKGLYLKNNGSAAIAFGADGTNPWVGLLNSTGTITLNPGAFILVGDPTAAGMIVVPSTGDILKAAGTGSDTFDIALLGGKT